MCPEWGQLHSSCHDIFGVHRFVVRNVVRHDPSGQVPTLVVFVLLIYIFMATGSVGMSVTPNVPFILTTYPATSGMLMHR